MNQVNIDRAIPTRADWGDLTKDPELAFGHQNFGGKSIGEVLPHIEANPIEAAAELRFTSSRVFNYYIWAFVQSLTPPKGHGEADMASSFLQLVLSRAKADPNGLQQIWAELQPVITHVSEGQAYYEAGASIYGSFSETAKWIEKVMASGS